MLAKHPNGREKYETLKYWALKDKQKMLGDETYGDTRYSQDKSISEVISSVFSSFSSVQYELNYFHGSWVR